MSNAVECRRTFGRHRSRSKSQHDCDKRPAPGQQSRTSRAARPVVTRDIKKNARDRPLARANKARLNCRCCCQATAYHAHCPVERTAAAAAQRTSIPTPPLVGAWASPGIVLVGAENANISFFVLGMFRKWSERREEDLKTSSRFTGLIPVYRHYAPSPPPANSAWSLSRGHGR